MINNIAVYRKMKNMSQENLACEIGKTRSYISDVERNVKNPSVKTLLRIADVLEVSLDDLLNRKLDFFSNSVRSKRTKSVIHDKRKC
ncbi:helix-turn-helix transcriptional regulator [Priestia sp. FSL W8-0001]|uniref:helix-turn-helix transcriptional regulator n=1 Tax=unclassified Priestia TaxID=2800374 RepID=UPI0030F90D64